jgi:hypothetical protein
MPIRLDPSNPLIKIPYVRVLQFAAANAANTGVKVDAPSVVKVGFTLDELLKDETMEKIDGSWLKELLPTICTFRQDQSQVAASEIMWEKHPTFVIKSDEFIKFANLVQVEKLSSLLEKSNELLGKSQASLSAAQETLIRTQALVDEAKSSSKTANHALLVACAAALFAVVIPFVVVKVLNSTVVLVGVEEGVATDIINKMKRK